MLQITSGTMLRPLKCCLYGPEGIGKTTFASRFPDPLFCDIEGGSGELNVRRTPTPSSWPMLLDTVRDLIQYPSQCKTFIIDTADWGERMCIKHVCDQNGQKGIETFGYGKGYVYVYEEFGKLLDLLTELTGKGIMPVLNAHAQLQKVEQPDELGSYDHYTLKLSKKTGKNVADMVKEWSDLLLFANYKTLVVNVDGQGATKGKNKAQGGKRVMYTSHTPSWDAKNRCGLPDELPFDYEAIRAVVESRLQCSPTQRTQEPTQEPLEELLDTPVKTAQNAPKNAPITPPDKPIAQEQTPPQTAPAAAAGYVEPSPTLPKALRDLMLRDQITEQEIMYAVGQKGYYPEDTPISRYDPEFVDAVLVGAWAQVRGMVLGNRNDVPF